MYLEPKDLPQQLRHLHSSGKIRVEPCTQMTIPADAGSWSGGTRRLFTAVELATGRTSPVTDTFSPPWDSSRRTRIVTLRPGYAVAETGSFCGKPAGLHLYLHPDNAAPLLPAPASLTRGQWEVLDVICGLKAAGREEEYRRRNLHDVAAIKASLVQLGMLDSRGAVTVKGRNARQSCPRPSPTLAMDALIP